MSKKTKRTRWQMGTCKLTKIFPNTTQKFQYNTFSQKYMDRPHKRYEERRIVRGIKESGDTKKPILNKANNDKSFPPDRGDSNQKPVQKTVNEKRRCDERHDTNIGKDTSLKKDKGREAKTLDAREKKIIREKYTLRLRSLNHVNADLSKPNEVYKATDNKNAEKPNKKALNESETPKVKESHSNNSKNSGKTDPKPEHETIRRKPVIKTIMSKNDTMRIFKAVTFVDQKKKPMTPLKIKIPTEVSKKHSRTIQTSVNKKVKTTVSRVSVKEKPVKKTGKFHRVRRHVTSPDLSARRVRSPPTEVAKWAPTSINHHTKPYYEAWVDTTLTAISKNYKKDQLFFDKQSIIKSFKKAFEERPLSPEIMYEKLSDEKFTGRIKVRHR